MKKSNICPCDLFLTKCCTSEPPVLFGHVKQKSKLANFICFEFSSRQIIISAEKHIMMQRMSGKVELRPLASNAKGGLVIAEKRQNKFVQI